MTMRINQVAGRVDQRRDGPSEKKEMQMQNAQVKCGGRTCHSSDIGRRDQAGATVNRLPSIVPGHAERQGYMGEKRTWRILLGRTAMPRDGTNLLAAAHSHRHPGLTWLQVTSTRLQDRARGSAPACPIALHPVHVLARCQVTTREGKRVITVNGAIPTAYVPWKYV